MKSFAALAFGLLAISPVFASEQVSSDLLARDAVFPTEQNLAKRGSYHTHGAKCRSNGACKTNVWMARPSCSAQGVCGFKCLHGYVKEGKKCVPPHHQNQCSRHTHCDIHVRHGSSFCWQGKCTFKCDRGYHREGDSCVKNQNKCTDDSCYPVADGYSTCEDGKCTYHCATYLGYSLFTNSKKTAYRCVALESDPENCGALGNVCPTGYNGLGVPYCSVGECQLSCAGYETKETMDGMPYCSNN